MDEGDHGRDLVAEWSTDAFVADATAWVDEVLAGAAVAGVRRARTGPLRRGRVRFWSTVLEVPVGDGRLWFKAANPGQAFEGAALSALAALVPDRVVAPLAVDESRGWWLLPDGGPTYQDLYSDGHGGAPGAPWAELLARVAELQQAVTPHGDRLAMVPRLGAAAALAWTRETLDALAALPPGDAQYVDPTTAAHVSRRLPLLEADLGLLDHLGIPDTLQPNDVNLGNVCVPTEPGAPPRLLDLGDAFWSHPFAVLHLPTRLAVGAALGSGMPRDPAADGLADAYLACWDVAPERRPMLRRAADRLGALHRAGSWQRLLEPVDQDPARLGRPVPRLVDWFSVALAAG
jgi:hypothetical protein